MIDVFSWFCFNIRMFYFCKCLKRMLYRYIYVLQVVWIYWINVYSLEQKLTTSCWPYIKHIQWLSHVVPYHLLMLCVILQIMQSSACKVFYSLIDGSQRARIENICKAFWLGNENVRLAYMYYFRYFRIFACGGILDGRIDRQLELALFYSFGRCANACCWLCFELFSIPRILQVPSGGSDMVLALQTC